MVVVYHFYGWYARLDDDGVDRLQKISRRKSLSCFYNYHSSMLKWALSVGRQLGA